MKRWTHHTRLHVPSPNNDNIPIGKKTPKTIVLEHVGKASLKIFHADYCMVAYLEGGEKHFIALGFEDGSAEKIEQLPQGIGLLGALWHPEQATIRLSDIATHRASSGCPHHHPALGAFLGTRICFDGETLGVIYLCKAPGGSPFTIEDETTIEVLASTCALELSNARTFEQLKDAYLALETRTTELDQAHQQLKAHEEELEVRTKALDKANKQLKVHAIDLELLNKELISANRAKDQFLANTSHELRTPLNAIIGFSDLLSDPRCGDLTAKQQRYVQHISNSGKRLLGIINALLDISKIESGMMDIQETMFAPAETGRQLISELRPLADNKQIDLVFNNSITDDIHILSDKNKIQQVLVNLVGNAIKFTPEAGRVELEISIQTADDGQQESTFCCRISDNGIGIAPEDQEKIFLPFIQASSGTTRSHGGTGLGLTLSKQIVELLGGCIQLSSTPEEGSTFHITFPVKTGTDLDAQPIAQATGTTAIEEATPEATPQPTIMLVDEHERRSASVKAMFDSEGYQVIDSRLDDVEKNAAKHHPFLIILGTPEDSKSIYTRLEQLKHSNTVNKIPTILLAGDAQNPRFSTGGTIGQIKHSMARNDLLDMVSHFGLHAPKPQRAPTVLVVDDDATVRDYLKETLVTEGFHVLLAGNGEEGINTAISRDPDLIILDLMMPGTSGFEVVHQLRDHPSACDIPVIIFTAKELTRSEALVLGQDVERILVKGLNNRSDVIQQLHKLELLYPVRAKLMDTKLDCFNFRYMQRRMEQEVARAERYGHYFTLIGWEMDGFEQYCQTHGKRWGLAAVKSSVAILHGMIRKGDILARLNQNRLMLLLPGLSLEESYCVAEKVRLRISHQHLPLPAGERGKMTVSIGGVGSREGSDSLGLISLLHQRIALAAAEGGNRTVMEE